MPVYKRVLIKLSGEALSGRDGAFSGEMLDRLAAVLVELTARGVQTAVVVGGGNIWRGKNGISSQMDPNTADHMGMLATAINALAIKDAVLRASEGRVGAQVMSAVEMHAFADHFSAREAIAALEAGRVVIFCCGTGSPFFTTDTAAVLRALEIGSDVVLMAKNVDGIYSADPHLDPAATRFDDITFAEVLERGLKATDNTATALCLNNDMPLLLFALDPPENILRVVEGESIGTRVHK